jgi:hypothetical protein
MATSTDPSISQAEINAIESLTIIYTAHAHLTKPNDQGLGMFVEMLIDIPPDILRQACKNIAMRTEAPWNVPATVKREANRLLGVMDADEAYALIEDLMTSFYAPELSMSSMNVIRIKLEERGKDFLFPLVRRWGAEIWYGDNPTATRAQFRNVYENELRRQDSALNLQAGKNAMRLHAQTKQLPESFNALNDVLADIEIVETGHDDE